MIRLYSLKDRQVREVEEGNDLVVRCLKRAGFVIGNLPPLPKPKEPVVEEPLSPTEGEDVDGEDQGEPVLAKHAPVGVPVADAADEETAEKPLSDMSMKELRAVAASFDLTVPSEIKCCSFSTYVYS